MHLHNIIQVHDILDVDAGLCESSLFSRLLILLRRFLSTLVQLLEEFVAFHEDSSVHEVIVHGLDEMKQLPLEQLQLVHELAKHDLVL